MVVAFVVEINTTPPTAITTIRRSSEIYFECIFISLLLHQKAELARTKPNKMHATQAVEPTPFLLYIIANVNNYSMKKYWLIGAILLCFILVLTHIVSMKNGAQEATSPITLNSVAKSETDKAPVVVTALNNDVLLKPATALDFQSVAVSATTSVGSTVKTSATGRSLIESSTAHKTLLDYNSEIIIKDNASGVSENKTSIWLSVGALWSRVEKVFDKGEFYEIKTSNAVASVRGTSFGVWYNNNTTTVRVTDGIVAFTALDENGNSIAGTEVFVKAGEKAERVGSGTTATSSITAKDRKLPWYIYNTASSTPVVQKEQRPVTPVVKPIVNIPAPQQTAPAPTPQTSLRIFGINPSSVVEKSTTALSIDGQGLAGVKTLFVGTIAVQGFKIIDDTTIYFQTPNTMTAGTYDVVVSDGNSSARRSITVTATPPPQTVPANNPKTTRVQ